MHSRVLHRSPRSWEYLLDRNNFSNVVSYFFPWENFMCVFFLLYSSLLILGIIVCICNMCKHNICLQVSSCVHQSLKQRSIWNARTFLKMLLLVNNSSCSECCISCTLSLLILKITQVTWFSLCAVKEYNRTAEWARGESSDFSLESFRQIFWGVDLTQGINNFIKVIFYLLD